MAFRSELDSARERADAAETEVKRLSGELEGQRARMERVEEIEGQLQTARAKLRQGADRPAVRAGLWVVLGIALGGGFAYWQGRMALDEERELSAAASARWRNDVAVAERTGEADRARAGELARTLEDEEAYFGRSRADLRELLLAFAGAPSPYDGRARWIELGRVVRTRGDVSVRVGDECTLVVESAGSCAADVRCGGTTVHSLGCETEPATTLSGDGTRLVIDHAFEARTVEIDASLGGRGPVEMMAPGSAATIGPGSLPPGVFPAGVDPRLLAPIEPAPRPTVEALPILGDPL